jgi:hypothetical protein
MEKYIKIPVLDDNKNNINNLKAINNLYQINNKLNTLNNNLINKTYDDFYMDLNLEIDNINDVNNKLSKNLIKKATFYIKIKDEYKNINLSEESIINCINYNSCPICLNTIFNKNDIIKLNCNHVFCTKCCDAWHSTCINNNNSVSCPICRSK